MAVTAAVPAGWAERGSALPAYVTPQLETLEQEEQERLEVTGVVVACPLPRVLPPCPVGCPATVPSRGCTPCKVAVGSPVSPPWLGHQLCPTSLVPIPYSEWQLGRGVSHNASGVIP